MTASLSQLFKGLAHRKSQAKFVSILTDTGKWFAFSN